MRKVLVPLLFALLAALTTSPPLHAGERAGAFSVSPYIGGYTFDGAQHLDTMPVYGLRLGYDITDNFGVEGVFNYVTTQSTKGYGHRNAISYRLDLLYNFQPQQKLVPYLAIGGGGTNLDATTFTKHTFSGTANIGGGLKYFLTDSIALRADARQIFLFNGNESLPAYYYDANNRTWDGYNEKNNGGLMFNWEYSVGVSFLFGPPKKPAPIVCPPPPPPAPKPKPLPPPPPKPEPMPEKICMTLNVEFDFDKSDVKPKYHDVIGKVAEFMQKYPKTTTVIEGHTDNRGSYQYNIKLAERRANSVRNYLIEKFNIEPARLSIKGYGYTKPIATNKTAEGRQKNRRIEAMIDCIIYVDKSEMK